LGGDATNTNPLSIGASSDGTARFFNGTIDEVRIYKRALAPEEIRTHYLRGSGFGASGAITADKFRIVNTTGGRVLEVNQSSFAVHTGGAERLKIDSSGNVGIGTSSPATKLDVQGDANISGTLSVGSFQMGSSSAATMNITGEAITFTGENGSLYQPVYGTDDDLVLYLPFSRGNASSSTTVYDRSPYGNDGTCNGVDTTFGCNWTTGKYGNALFFDGTNDYVDVGDIANINVDDITVEAWIKHDSFNNFVRYVARGKTGACVDPFVNVYLGTFDLGDNNKPRFALAIGGSTQQTPSDVGFTMSLNTWHHIVGTYDGLNMKLYTDGNLVSTVSAPGQIDSNSNEFVIGAENDGCTGGNFDGTVDETRIYKRALTADEIRTHYLRGSGFGASGAITADKFRIVNTSGDVKFIVDNDGRVGIGAVNPAKKLHVNVSDSSEILRLERSDGGSNANAWDFRVVQVIGTALGSLQLKPADGYANADFYITDKDDNVFFLVEDSGNVGINTTSPAQTLTVQGTLNVTPAGKVDNVSLFVDSVGNVGIGTPSPRGTLEVLGNLTVTNSNTFRDPAALLHVYGTNQEIRMSSDHNMAAGEVIGIGLQNSGIYSWDMVMDGDFDSGRSLIFRNGGLTSGTGDLLTLSISNRVGVMNTAPSYTLDVNGTFRVTNTSEIVGLFQDKSANVGIGTESPATTLDVQGKLNVTGNTSIAQDTLFVDNTSGRVGIGTESPATLFEVDDGGAHGNHTFIRQGGAGDFGLLIGTDTASARTYIQGWRDTIGAEKLNINPFGGLVSIGYDDNDQSATLAIKGNLSIETTTPKSTTKLTIAGGGVDNGGTIALFNTDSNVVADETIGNITWYTQDSQFTGQVGTITLQANGNTEASDLDFDMKFFNSDSNGVNAERMRIQGGGNVGIGNTLPNNTLDVSGDANITGTIYSGGGGAAVARMTTGSYTGDGTTSQAITGIGFQVKWVWITPRETADNQNVYSFFSSDVIVDDHASGMAFQMNSNPLSDIDRIIALGADGFTVDDAGGDAHPNANGILYNYVAWG